MESFASVRRRPPSFCQVLPSPWKRSSPPDKPTSDNAFRCPGRLPGSAGWEPLRFTRGQLESDFRQSAIERMADGPHLKGRHGIAQLKGDITLAVGPDK